MLIRKIQVSNFKRLKGPLTIEGLGNGINIIGGDNEEGKSTLLQAIKALVFQKHNAKTQAVSDFRPYNAAVRPSIGMDLEFGDKKYSITKSFCVKATAQFRSADSLYEDAEAEEKIRELFGIQKAEKDHGIWGLLWLEQGVAEDGLGTTEGGRETIMRALDNNLSTVVAGQRGRALSKQIEVQYLKFYTPGTKKEKGELAKASEDFESLKTKLADCKSRYAQYETKLASLQSKQKQLTQHEQDKTVENARAEVSRIANEKRTLDDLKLELKGLEDAERAAQLEYKEANRISAERSKATQTIKDSTTKLTQLEVELTAKNKALTLTEEKLAAADKAKQETEQERIRIEHHCKEIELKEEHKRLVHSKDELQGKIDALKGIDQQIAVFQEEQSKITINEKIVQKLRDLEQDLLIAEVRCNTAATRVVLSPLQGQLATVDGKDIEVRTELSITTTSKLEIKGWGSIEITPGGDKTEEYANQLAELKEAFRKSLNDAEVDTVAKAESILRRSKDINLSILALKREVESTVGKTGLKGLRDELDQITAKLQSIDPLTTKHDDKAISLTELRTQLDLAKSNESKASALVATEKENTSNTKIEITRLEADKKNTQAHLSEAEAILQTHKESAEQQEQVQKTAANKLAAAAARLQTDKEILAKLDEHSLISRKAEAEKACTTIEGTIKQLRDETIRLGSEINTEGQSGLGDQLQQLEGEVELAQKKLERLRSQAEALKLLHETLQEAQAESKSRVLQPILEILRPHLHDFFPGSELVLDHNDIEISQLVRDGNAESYKKLSTGTREQISVLTRIAVAQLLRQQGQASVLLLDDALVHSDDKRFSKMKALLSKVSTELQILILTCRTREYLDIPDCKVIEF